MTAGIELITEDGHLQIATGMTFFRLVHKEVLAGGTGWGQYGSNSSQRDITIAGLSLANAPMIALASASATWATLISTSGGLTWRIYRTVTPTADDVTIYIFDTSPPPSDPGFGLAVYDGSGAIVFSSEYPIARPIGVFDQGGYAGLERTGRDCAHVPQKQGTSQYQTFTAAGLGSCVIGSTQGYQIYQSTGWGRTGIACKGDGLAAANHVLQVNNVPAFCSPSPTAPAGTSSSSSSFRALIIDVTDL